VPPPPMTRLTGKLLIVPCNVNGGFDRPTPRRHRLPLVAFNLSTQASTDIFQMDSDSTLVRCRDCPSQISQSAIFSAAGRSLRGSSLLFFGSHESWRGRFPPESLTTRRFGPGIVAVIPFSGATCATRHRASSARSERRSRDRTTTTCFWSSRSQSRVLRAARGLGGDARDQSPAPLSSQFGFIADRFAARSKEQQSTIQRMDTVSGVNLEPTIPHQWKSNRAHEAGNCGILVCSNAAAKERRCAAAEICIVSPGNRPIVPRY
jgi:hypothetical protein